MRERERERERGEIKYVQRTKIFLLVQGCINSSKENVQSNLNSSAFENGLIDRFVFNI